MKKDMLIKIGIGIAIIFTILLILFILYNVFLKEKKTKEEKQKYSSELLKLMNQEEDYDELLEIEFSNSGNSNGNINNLRILPKEKKIIVENKEFHSDPLQVKEYSLPEEYQEVEDMLKKYKFPMWKDLKEKRDLMALDASTISLTFTYDNSKKNGSKMEWYTISFEKEMPEDGREALQEFCDKLHALVKEENKIKEYTKEEE